MTTDPALAFFDCIFSGVLDVSEGGNGPLYEKSNDSPTLRRFQARLHIHSPFIVIFILLERMLKIGARCALLLCHFHVVARNTAGEILSYDGSRFFWELFDIPRRNFDLYDEVIESWRLMFIA